MIMKSVMVIILIIVGGDDITPDSGLKQSSAWALRGFQCLGSSILNSPTEKHGGSRGAFTKKSRHLNAM